MVTIKVTFENGEGCAEFIKMLGADVTVECTVCKANLKPNTTQADIDGAIRKERLRNFTQAAFEEEPVEEAPIPLEFVQPQAPVVNKATKSDREVAASQYLRDKKLREKLEKIKMNDPSPIKEPKLHRDLL